MSSQARASRHSTNRLSFALRIGASLVASLVLGVSVLGRWPGPSPAAPFRSGGLGLTRAESQHHYRTAAEAPLS